MLPAADNQAQSIAGAWRLNILGATFVPHLATFLAGGVFLLTNPEAGTPATSYSVGMGEWKPSEEHPDAILCRFQELTVDRESGEPGLLDVTLSLRLRGPFALGGSGEARYYNSEGVQQGEPLKVTLNGIRILLSPPPQQTVLGWKGGMT